MAEAHGSGNAALLACAAGAATGAVVLGVGGYLAMAGVALVSSGQANLSATGALESAGLGALLGLAGGLLLHALAARPRGQRGVLVGLVLFVAAVAIGWLSGRIDFARPVILLTLAVAALVYVAFGVCTAALLARFRGETVPAVRD